MCREADRAVIHEAMEQQTVHVAKVCVCVCVLIKVCTDQTLLAVCVCVQGWPEPHYKFTAVHNFLRFLQQESGLPRVYGFI